MSTEKMTHRCMCRDCGPVGCGYDGEGHCQTCAEKMTKTYTEECATRIAWIVFPHNTDRIAREQLERLLVEFAAEIKRSAIEP